MDDLIYPVFVTSDETGRQAISSMPGPYQLSIPDLVEEAKEVNNLRIPAIILFGISENKDEKESDAYGEDAVVQRATKAVKDSVSDLIVMTDVCLCAYTDHGHCGVVKDGEVDNDLTLELLARQAISHAKAGEDFNRLETVEELFYEHPEEIAALIVKPMAGNMGCVPPVKGFLEGLREVTRAHGSLLIFDEVIMGFRVGPGGVQEAFKVTPDLTTLGKVIGGGLSPCGLRWSSRHNESDSPGRTRLPGRNPLWKSVGRCRWTCDFGTCF